jgi:hypothetical protein
MSPAHQRRAASAQRASPSRWVSPIARQHSSASLSAAIAPCSCRSLTSRRTTAAPAARPAPRTAARRRKRSARAYFSAASRCAPRRMPPSRQRERTPAPPPCRPLPQRGGPVAPDRGGRQAVRAALRARRGAVERADRDSTTRPRPHVRARAGTRPPAFRLRARRTPATRRARRSRARRSPPAATAQRAQGSRRRHRSGHGPGARGGRSERAPRRAPWPARRHAGGERLGHEERIARPCVRVGRVDTIRLRELRDRVGRERLHFETPDTANGGRISDHDRSGGARRTPRERAAQIRRHHRTRPRPTRRCRPRDRADGGFGARRRCRPARPADQPERQNAVGEPPYAPRRRGLVVSMCRGEARSPPIRGRSPNMGKPRTRT